MNSTPAPLDSSVTNVLQPRRGDLVMLFRLDESSNASALAAQHAILALLRRAGFIPDNESDPDLDEMDIREFQDRGKLQTPIARRFGRLEGWHRPTPGRGVHH